MNKNFIQPQMWQQKHRDVTSCVHGASLITSLSSAFLCCLLTYYSLYVLFTTCQSSLASNCTSQVASPSLPPFTREPCAKLPMRFPCVNKCIQAPSQSGCSVWLMHDSLVGSSVMLPCCLMNWWSSEFLKLEKRWGSAPHGALWRWCV